MQYFLLDNNTKLDHIFHALIDLLQLFEYPYELKWVKNHYNRVHEELSEYKFECEKCHTKFQFKSRLETHMEANADKSICDVQNGQKKYFCSYKNCEFKVNVFRE